MSLFCVSESVRKEIGLVETWGCPNWWERQGFPIRASGPIRSFIYINQSDTSSYVCMMHNVFILYIWLYLIGLTNRLPVNSSYISFHIFSPIWSPANNHSPVSQLSPWLDSWGGWRLTCASSHEASQQHIVELLPYLIFFSKFYMFILRYHGSWTFLFSRSADPMSGCSSHHL